MLQKHGEETGRGQMDRLLRITQAIAALSLAGMVAMAAVALIHLHRALKPVYPAKA